MKKLPFYFFLIAITISCNKKKDPEPGPVNEYVNSRDYRKLVVEIVFQKGMQLNSGTLSQTRSFLESFLDKPGGIEIAQKEIATVSTGTYNFSEIQSLEQNNRGARNSGETTTIYVFVADAEYADNPSVLGIAYGGSSIVLFERTIRKHSGGLAQPSTQLVETTVLEHEYGHLMGLVNNGVEMQNDHQDPAHSHHCNNNKCLMYWAAETSDVVSNLLGGTVPALDEACRLDLQAEKSK